jgi:hypothetical protein
LNFHELEGRGWSNGNEAGMEEAQIWVWTRIQYITWSKWPNFSNRFVGGRDQRWGTPDTYSR